MMGSLSEIEKAARELLQESRKAGNVKEQCVATLRDALAARGGSDVFQR